MKNVCPICRHDRVTTGHLCSDCFSPKLVQYDAEKDKRNAMFPVFSNNSNLNSDYTPIDAEELLPIPELVEDPLAELTNEDEGNNQSETSSLIADIEATLRMIGADDDEIKISASRVRREKEKEEIRKSAKKIPARKEFQRVSKLVKKKETQSENQQITDETSEEKSENAEVKEQAKLEHTNKVNQKKVQVKAEKRELNSHELKKLAKINIKKQLKELEAAILGFSDETDKKEEPEHTEKFDFPELIIDDADENDEIAEKWDKIKDMRVTAVNVEKEIERNYHNNRLPLKLAEYEQSIAMMLGSKNFYELPVSWRLKARFKAFNDARVLLNEEQASKIRHITLLEHKNEEYNKNKQGILDADMIKNGNWKWFLLTSVVHTVFLIMLWSVILVEAAPDDPDRVSYFDSDANSKDLDNAELVLDPEDDKKRVDPKKYEEDYNNDYVDPDMQPNPNIPAVDINPFDAQSKEDKRIRRDPNVVSETSDLGIDASNRGDEEESGDEKGTGAGNGTPLKSRGDLHKPWLDKYGGDGETENAVQLGLKWLAGQQNHNGSWAAKDAVETGKAHPEGYTALALLCFLGYGHTENNGEYKETVKKAVEYLLYKQKANETGVISSSVSGMIYNHSISTLALAEYYTMTRREDLVEPIKRALRFLYNTQQASGGWDYTSNKLQNRTDMSITGWVFMAMHSAMTAGIPVNQENWNAAYRGILELVNSDGTAYYSLNGNVYPGRKGLAMTAVSVLCRLYARVPLNDRTLEKSIRWLKNNPPSQTKLKSRKSKWGRVDYRKLKNDDDFFHTTYYWYYGTLSMFMATNGKGKDWERWNKAMKKAILSYQVTKGNVSKGSWEPIDSFWGDIGGRLYSTCLNILNLEIYYRYLPLYNKEGHALRFGENVVSDDEKKPTEKPADSMIKTVEEAERIINDSTKPDSDKLIAITFLKVENTDESVQALLNVLWNKNTSEMIRWRVVSMLADFPNRSEIVGALIDAYDVDFNENLQIDILKTLAKLRRKESLLFVASKLDSSEETDIRNAALNALEGITTSRFGLDRTAWTIWINNNFD